jgi:propionyl-CoA synthetase
VIPDEGLEKEIQALVRKQIGAIASLGGVIQGKGMIPKTRSGKTLRRVLRELLEREVEEAAAEGEIGGEKATGKGEKKRREINVPATVEDASVVEVAERKVGEYFKVKGLVHKGIEVKAKL